MADFAITEDFNYTNGDLNGQNGGSGWSGAWSGDVLYDVASATPPTGATKYVEATSAATEPTMSRSFSATADSGNYYFSIKLSTTGDSLGINWKKGTDRAIDIAWVSGGGNITMTGTSAVTIISGPTIDTWYDVNIQFVTATTMKARGKLSSSSSWGSYTSNVTLGVTGSPSGFDNVTLRYNQGGGATATMAWARFQPTDPSAPTVNSNFLMFM